MSQSRDLACVIDILRAARRIQSRIAGVGAEDFQADEDKQDIVIRQLEIIGEATKRLSEEFREAYPARGYEMCLFMPMIKWICCVFG